MRNAKCLPVSNGDLMEINKRRYLQRERKIPFHTPRLLKELINEDKYATDNVW